MGVEGDDGKDAKNDSATGSRDTSSIWSFLDRELYWGMTVKGWLGFFPMERSFGSQGQKDRL